MFLIIISQKLENVHKIIFLMIIFQKVIFFKTLKIRDSGLISIHYQPTVEKHLVLSPNLFAIHRFPQTLIYA